ncbi:unnamed protein product [Dibothriocephalus latus]|uniref:Uncharacterized protein n=1 Tax=Dibothriocephalus latus TaxID=60516 RepID=A0A3P7LEX8_DIBLA|nr:unnamed protein product [Dibothriocephalus latus]
MTTDGCCIACGWNGLSSGDVGPLRLCLVCCHFGLYGDDPAGFIDGCASFDCSSIIRAVLDEGLPGPRVDFKTLHGVLLKSLDLLGGEHPQQHHRRTVVWHTPQTSSTKTSLENKSKNSRSRVHYGKFVRAKDVSQYSKKSLKIVLGTPLSAPDRPAQSVDDMAVPTTTTGTTQDPANIHLDFGIKTYSSALDLKDYFAMKRRQKIGKGTLDSDRGIKRRELSPSALAGARVSFSLGPHSQETAESDSADDARVSFSLGPRSEEKSESHAGGGTLAVLGQTFFKVVKPSKLF